MKLTPENLTAHGFMLQDKLSHQELVPFIQTYMKKRTPSVITYYAINIVALAGLLFGMFGPGKGLALDQRIMQISLGVAMSLLFIPLHEYIHVLAYKSQGAQRTSYAANIRKFYFMALADGFVANRKAFRVVALAPFMVITFMLLVAVVILPSTWSLLPLSAIQAHAAMCSGDFGLLSYFDVHKQKDVVTYDDVANGTSYFYAREVQESRQG